SRPVALRVPEHYAVLEFALPYAVAPRTTLGIARRSRYGVAQVPFAGAGVIELVEPTAVRRGFLVIRAVVGAVVAVVHQSRGDAVTRALVGRRPARGIPGTERQRVAAVGLNVAL